MNKQHGYIALMSVLIVSALFLIFLIEGSLRTIAYTSSVLLRYDRDKAVLYSDACVEHALIELQRVNDYHGGDTLDIGDGSCRVRDVLMTGRENRTIHVESSKGAYTSRVVVVVDSLTPVTTVSSYDHVTEF